MIILCYIFDALFLISFYFTIRSKISNDTATIFSILISLFLAMFGNFTKELALWFPLALTIGWIIWKIYNHFTSRHKQKKFDRHIEREILTMNNEYWKKRKHYWKTHPREKYLHDYPQRAYYVEHPMSYFINTGRKVPQEWINQYNHVKNDN